MHHLATIRLIQLDDDNRQIGFASGCIVRYQDAYFVLTFPTPPGIKVNGQRPGKGDRVIQNHSVETAPRPCDGAVFVY